MGNLGLSYEDVHWSRHPAAHAINRLLDLEAVFLHSGGRLAHIVLRPGQGPSIPRSEDHRGCVSQ
jgi:hypothetical protein